MYVQRDIEAHSCKHCCSGKTIIIIQPVLFVVLSTQHEMRMGHTVIRGVSGFKIFFYIIS
jgi:hypothetical protein